MSGEAEPAPAYPAHLLARTPAPPYAGEGPFALWHMSEDPSLHRFAPRPSPTGDDACPMVWAIDTRHQPTFWFPRDCPRLCLWPGEATTPEDRERFFGQSALPRVHVIEGAWLDRVRSCELYAYRLRPGPFRPHSVGGYWISDQTVEAEERVAVSDLLARHVEAGIELRIVGSIWPISHRVVASTVEYSGSRLRNASPDPGAGAVT
jgi:hypothetical protein